MNHVKEKRAHRVAGPVQTSIKNFTNTLTANEKKELDNLLLEWILEDMQAWNVVESEGLQQFIFKVSNG